VRELAALRVDDGRDVVVVMPAEERELASGVHVPRGQLFEMRDDLGLGERRLQVELAVEPNPGRDVAEELVGRRDADRGEHLLAVAFRQREEAHCSSTNAL
jgi:hypothetical protein